MRSYMKGDSLKSIHWKNYARTGNLMVRLPEKQNSDMLSLILMTEESGNEDSDLQRRDLYLEYLISVANYFAQMKKPVRVVYFDSGVKTFVIDGYKTFQEFYYERLKSTPQGQSLWGNSPRGTVPVGYFLEDVLRCENGV